MMTSKGPPMLGGWYIERVNYDNVVVDVFLPIVIHETNRNHANDRLN